MPTLNWIGKDAVIRHHKDVPFRLLEADENLSHAPDDEPQADGNLIVQGDNLHALKALLPKYAGKVKCIYIDPPYNTGNEGWVYNDKVNAPEIKKWLGETVGKEAEDLSRHDKWLCMMYPRMVLLKQFLTEDGAIFVSIDDNEVASLRLLMDEIFGKLNFMAEFVWQKAYSPRMDALIASNDHDSIICYSRGDKKLNRLSFEQNKSSFTLVDEKSGKFYRRRQWRKEGSQSLRKDRPNLYYSITAPDGSDVLPIKPDGKEGRWRGKQSTYDTYASNNEIEWVNKNGVWQIYVKQFADAESTRPPSTWMTSDYAGHNHEAAEEIKGVFHNSAFATPKPTRLIQRILQIATDKDSIILDSFAGSGTTGHAVLKQNAEDGGNRKFILVEMEETIAQTITAERVRRVASGYKDAKGNKVEGLGSGFQFCHLSDEPLFNEFGDIRDDVSFAQLADFVWFAETGHGRDGCPSRPPADSPLLGTHEGHAIYLLFNGILGDRRPDGGNILTRPILDELPAHDGPKTIYAAATRLGENSLQREQITFKQTPYAIEV